MTTMGMTSGGAGGESQSPELKCAVPVAFRWHHSAQREVYVVGSFSNWQTKIRLTRYSNLMLPADNCRAVLTPHFAPPLHTRLGKG
jgi:hypothetical protein